MHSSIKLGRVAGIEIGLHFSWLIIAGLTAWSLSTAYFPYRHGYVHPTTSWLLGIISALLLFAAVLIHELSHSLVAQTRGLRVRSITLFIFGGVATIGGEPQRPQSELLIAIAGPVASLALAAISLGVSMLFDGVSWTVVVVAEYLAMMNLTLAVFNMIPGFPLDGGRVLRSVIWQISGDVRWATKVAATVGTLVAYLFVAYGIWEIVAGNLLNGLWATAIGWFLSNAAQSSLPRAVGRPGPTGVRVAEAMQVQPIAASEDTLLDELIEEYFLRHNQASLPIVRDGVLTGMVTLRDVRQARRADWPTTTVRTVMTPREELHTVNPWDDLSTTLELFAREDLDRLPVLEGAFLVGMLSRSDVVRLLHPHGKPVVAGPRRSWRWPSGG